MPVSPKRMPFLSHVNELRKRLTVIIAVVTVLSIVGYYYSDEIYRLLLGPMLPVLKDSGGYTLDLLEAMSNRFRLGIFGAVVAGSPVIIYEILAFFVPALKPNERRWFGWTALAAGLLFIAGVAFCYLYILAPSAEWLVQQNGETFKLMLRAQSAMTFAMWFLAGFGLAFEVPVIVFYLVYFNVVPYAKLRKNWRIVWVVVVIVAAMITPDWNPWSMMALAGVMIALFEASMLFVRIMLSRKIKSSAALESALEAE